MNRRHFGSLALAALAIAGCGSQEEATTGAHTTAEATAQKNAEAVFERDGVGYYIGILRPSTVRFSSPCQVATSGRWRCAGWGLIAIEGGEGKPGECEFVEGDVTANGLAGEPSGEAMSFSGSPCQVNLGLGEEGRKPNARLVATWVRKQQTEKRQTQAHEEGPSGQEQKREEAQQEAEEAKRTNEARGAEESG